ncbi:MAG: alpha-2-macroglobulin [Prevotella sp.]|nr:alpha-2-macroglobulin [Prevotella sp.]
MRLIWIFCFIILANMDMMAQTYDQLWSDVKTAQSKDLPKTQKEVLDKIVVKATNEKEYGQLIKAQLKRVEAITAVTPDSLKPEVEKLVKWEQEARKETPALAAVLQSILGTIYEDNRTLGDDHVEKGLEYLKNSLSNPTLLGNTTTGAFVPAMTEGEESKYFNNDLLHVLGKRVNDYALLHDYYDKTGNREAACLTAAWMLEEKPMTKEDLKVASSPKVREVDSLLARYGDLPISGELAIIKYHLLEEADDVTPAQLMAYIDDTRAKYGEKWPRIITLDNKQQELTRPFFSLEAGCEVILPNTKRKVDVNGLRNISSLTMKVARVNLDLTRKTYSLYNDDDLKVVRKAIVKGSQIEVTHHYEGHQPYETFKDSIDIPPLQNGLYLVEFFTGDKIVSEARDLMYVSDLYLVRQPLPEKKTRFAVLSATTGKPVPGAKIRIMKRKDETTLTCNKEGEVIWSETEDNWYRPDFYVYTSDDQACPKQDLWLSSYSYSTPAASRKSTSLFTDRSIYRPGQQVHLAIIRHECLDGMEERALEGETMKVTLRDANHKEVETKEVVTDEFGKAALDFTLPSSGLTGRFTINTNGGSTSIRVEEYKRPTFQVEIPMVEEAYKDGDTITVKGYAKSFAGVPVQGANVTYYVERQASWWWWGRNDDDGDISLANDSTVTDEDGAFTMRVPMCLPETFGGRHPRPRFYNIIVNATVTDQAFETHEARLSLPLSDKATALGISVADIMRSDEMKPVVFTLRNAAGKTVDGMVEYTIDGEKPQKAEANKNVNLPKLKSGKHVVEAICLGDTVKKEFVIFSIDDKRPCYQTHDWFYASDWEFDSDGKPVVVQVGTSDNDTHVLYTVFTEDKVLEQGAFKLSNANQTRKWTYKKEYGSGVLITFAWVKEGVLYSHTHTIRKPMPDKRIILSWETFRDKLTPGQEETWTLKAEKPDGTPADVQLMATLYDKSLDQIASHSWSFYDLVGVNTPSSSWGGFNFGDVSMGGSAELKLKSVPMMHFTSIDPTLFNLYEGRFFMNARAGGSAMRRMKGVKMEEPMPMVMAESRVLNRDMDDMADAVAEDAEMKLTAPVVKKDEVVKKEKAQEEAVEELVQVRENLDETAFFMPMVAADENGRLVLKFKLPEAVTTWKFIGLATDKEINHGFINAETVAKKDVMVMPNVPRFVRLGDKAQVTTRIVNTTERSLKGKATMQLLDAETEEVVWSQEMNFEMEANQTTNATFDYEPMGEAKLLVCRIIAKGEGFSDGEQHFLPVLPAKELITRTVPFTQNGPKTSIFNLQQLFPQGVEGEKLTIEYTNNPAWLMIQALPTMAAGDSDNAITQATSYYANALGQHIINLSPVIKQTVMKWREETSDKGSMASSLAKNEELKELMLNETPWVGAADKEESQKRSLVKFFDEQTINIRIDKALEKLKDLQLADGSWAWWKGMQGSTYMTVAVSEIFVRLNNMVGKRSDNKKMLDKAFTFMDKELAEEEAYLRKMQKKGLKVLPSETALHILYIYALDAREPSAKTKATIKYLIDLFESKPTEFTIYGKARAAVILAYFNKQEKARQYMRSLDEYSIATEEMGRYYDTRKAYYSWCSYNIPTEVAAIEAFKQLQPDNTTTIDEMRRWLLQQKRAQMWNTPINSVDAIYAFLQGNEQSLDSSVQTKLTIDGQPLETPEATAGLGYVKTAMDASGKTTLTVEKTSQGTSWGALYAQFTQDAVDVEDSKAGIAVTRELRTESGTLNVGDKVVVRITIKAERNLDFVEVVDKRAACMEPVQQTSGYYRGCFIANKDNTTNYYFDHLAKGTHVVETEYYIDRKGTYLTGTCKAQCAYAPEFAATTKALKVVVNK